MWNDNESIYQELSQAWEKPKAVLHDITVEFVDGAYWVVTSTKTGEELSRVLRNLPMAVREAREKLYYPGETKTQREINLEKALGAMLLNANKDRAAYDNTIWKAAETLNNNSRFFD